MPGFNPNKINGSNSNSEESLPKKENRNGLENFNEVDISNQIPVWLTKIIKAIKQKVAKGEKYSVYEVFEELNNTESGNLKDSFYDEVSKDGSITGIFNKISNGTYLDNRYLNHVIFGKNTYRSSGEEEHTMGIKEGKAFSPEGIIEGYKLEFAVGYNTHFGNDPTKKMIIINPESEALKRFMSSKDNSYGWSFENVLRDKFNSEQELDEYIDSLKLADKNGKVSYVVDRKDMPLLWELLKRKLPIREKDSQDMGNGIYAGFGFALPIMEGDRGSRWCDVADTIIDLEQGKAWYRKT